MNTRAKLYIAAVLLTGLIPLAGALVRWEQGDLARFLMYLLLGTLAATWKVRLPMMNGTISMNFAFVLFGVADFALAETVVASSWAALVQSVRKPKSRPKLVQVAFNVATLSISSFLAYSPRWWGGWVTKGQAPLPQSLLLVVAACILFLSNTLLVAGVIAMVESKSLPALWRQYHLLTLPYYAIGGLVAAFLSFSMAAVGWVGVMLLIPAMYLTHTYYRIVVDGRTAAAEQAEAAAA